MAAMLGDSKWDREVASKERTEAEWHRWLLQVLVRRWSSNFLEVVRSGEAHIMARSNSILSPFRRITWDQWQFFRVDDPPLPTHTVWHDVRESIWSSEVPSTATGPAGERLYSIYVAPGIEIDDSGQTAENECCRWLTQLLREYPDRSPRPLAVLAEEAVSTFVGLSKRGFSRCYAQVQANTGNKNWRRPGAPKKLYSNRRSKENF